MTEPLVLKVKRLHPNAAMPTRAHPADAGLDLASIEAVTLRGGETRAVSTGLALEIPPGWYGQVRGRSSLSKWGVEPGGGVIDASYRGQVLVVLTNHGTAGHEVRVGDRVAQLTLHRVPVVDLVEVEELGETPRGKSGFGSSDARPADPVRLTVFRCPACGWEFAGTGPTTKCPKCGLEWAVEA